MLTKRVFDISISLVLLIILIPVIIIIGVCIMTSLGSPIFFIQKRPGLHSKPFNLIKFRSMKEKIDVDGILSEDRFRITPFGSFIRKYSIDELPELWNVLKGEMSLVGPRPLLLEYIPLYSKEQLRRHNILPGITGWAQINGRNAISWEEKFEYDLWYIDNHSFLLDIKILYITLKKIIIKEGIYNSEGQSVSKFKGNK
jgi:lipopolysaccharide/colanic/teichoic acid biosynthesis glycosyltransferase